MSYFFRVILDLHQCLISILSTVQMFADDFKLIANSSVTGGSGQIVIEM